MYRVFAAQSEKKFQWSEAYEKSPSLIRNQGNSNKSNSGSPFFTIKFVKVKKVDNCLILRISRNGYSLT